MEAKMQELRERLDARTALDEQHAQQRKRSEEIAQQFMNVFSEENGLTVRQAEEILKCTKRMLRSVRV